MALNSLSSLINHSMMTIKPELIADHECWTGEGPLWHPDHKAVYWVDIPKGELLRYDTVSGNHEQCLSHDNPIGSFTIQENGDLLLFLDRGTIRSWNETDGVGHPITEDVVSEYGSRFNDVIADPRGRVFCGTMPTQHPSKGGGRLYRLDPNGSLTLLLEDIAIPNGMGFAPDRRQFYFTETGADSIYRFDYDLASGVLSNREIFVETSDESGSPDGMTVDAEGYVWSARWDGGCLVRYAPDGTEDYRIDLPARKVSSITFGGPSYGESYITTALGPAEGEPGVRRVEGEGAGALFRLSTPTSGIPEFRSRIEL